MKDIERFFQNLEPTTQQLPQGVAILGTLDPTPPLIFTFLILFLNSLLKVTSESRKKNMAIDLLDDVIDPQKLCNFWKFHFFLQKNVLESWTRYQMKAFSEMKPK